MDRNAEMRRVALMVVRAMADLIAEELVTHQHDCPARATSLVVLWAAGLEEESFFTAWGDGAYERGGRHA